MSGVYLEQSDIGDDYQVMDLVPFIATAVSTVAADILFEGTGTCVCPDNYTMVAQVVNVVNKSGSALTATIQITNGTLTIALLEVVLAANTALGGNQIAGPNSGFRLIAPPTWKFQAVATAASVDVQMLVRLVLGAGL